MRAATFLACAVALCVCVTAVHCRKAGGARPPANRGRSVHTSTRRLVAFTAAAAADTALSEEGYDTVEPELMGLCAYGHYPNASWLETDVQRGVSIVGHTDTSNVYELPDSPPGGGAWTSDAARAWYTRPETQQAVNESATVAAMRQDVAAGVASHLYAVGQVPGLTLGPDCSHISDQCVPTEPTVYGVVVSQFMRAVRRFVSPPLTRVHLLNEPNAHFWKVKNPRTGRGFNGTYYAKFFVKAATAIHSDLADAFIGGPVTYCPPTGESSITTKAGWTDFAKPLLDAGLPSGQLDYFDFHSYDDPADYLVSEVTLVKGYARSVDPKSRRVPIRSAITENNYRLPSMAAWWNRTQHVLLRTLPLAELTLALVAHPDKVFARHLFDYHDTVTYLRIMGYANHTHTPDMQLIELLRPLMLRGGTRLATGTLANTLAGHPVTSLRRDCLGNHSACGDGAAGSSGVKLEVVRVASGSGDGFTIYVCMINLNAEAAVAAAVSLTQLGGAKLLSSAGEVVDTVSYRPLDTVPVPNSGATIMLPGASVSLLSYEFAAASSRGASGPTQAVERAEYFAEDCFMTEIPSPTAATSCTVTLPAVAASSPPLPLLLRLSLKGPATLANWTVTLDLPEGQQQLRLAAPGPYVEQALPGSAGPRQAAAVAISIRCSGDCSSVLPPPPGSFVKVVALVTQAVVAA